VASGPPAPSPVAISPPSAAPTGKSGSACGLAPGGAGWGGGALASLAALALFRRRR
jgi:hypothetical protein